MCNGGAVGRGGDAYFGDPTENCLICFAIGKDGDDDDDDDDDKIIRRRIIFSIDGCKSIDN